METRIETHVLQTADAAALTAAEFVAHAAREAVAARGRCLLAVSGGSTPQRMFDYLAQQDVPWPHVHLFQVDERIAPDGDPARNFTQLCAALLDRLPTSPGGVYAMPVHEPDAHIASAVYAHTLATVAGRPITLDLVHLGLGTDGHTASLQRDDVQAMNEGGDVAVAQAFGGFRRLTLTLPLINRARRVLWLVTGTEKRTMLERLLAGDESIPAGRVHRDAAVLFADTLAWSRGDETTALAHDK